MERAVLRIVADYHWPQLNVDEVEVVSREHTGVGRYTNLLDRADQPVPDGTYGAAAHIIEMDGVPGGLFFVVETRAGRVDYIEIVSAGGEAWDGVERAWKMR
jgi:hypothetical protein